ncbi:hypothetical protein BRADI_3g16346v3 [Brachypodium distachyon]|uniref:Uncharacterized protein n=1 Tax=Brachypodium distachyon TaxID=15368 RepID=A0A2K2CXI9_BRADI|nr:hypothetical protein BRADI_3g16346v3 [Brachypodium distachyon]
MCHGEGSRGGRFTVDLPSHAVDGGVCLLAPDGGKLGV